MTDDERRARDRARKAARWQSRPEEGMWRNARARARTHGLPFDLDISDISIPELCPILGIPLVRSMGAGQGPRNNSPTLDRIVPSLGYVKGNVQVISHKANTMKGVGSMAFLMARIGHLQVAA